VRCDAASLHALLPALQAQWMDFQASYARLPIDTYMADGGRYRRRRYAVFSLSADGAQHARHQPHYQSTLYNRVNGGIERWFEPIEADILRGATLQSALRLCYALFAPLKPAVPRWHTEVHQFRIEANAEQLGQPTPEGMHRDGVDFVLVMLVQRVNVLAGTTTLHTPDGAQIAEFTLTQAGDAVWLDDQRLLHGVTPVLPADAKQAAFRDVLVITLKAAAD
jgi:hypothetical protein